MILRIEDDPLELLPGLPDSPDFMLLGDRNAASLPVAGLDIEAAGDVAVGTKPALAGANPENIET